MNISFDSKLQIPVAPPMKKEEPNNKKLTDYFQLKGITPLGRILNPNNTNLSNLAPRQPTKISDNKRKTADEERVQIEWSEQKQTNKQNEKKSNEVCKQLIMIGPADTRYYHSSLSKLRLLQENYTKHDLLKFVLANAKFHNITNLTILQSVKDELFWNKTVPKMLQYVLTSAKQLSISSKVPMLPARTPRMVEVTRAQVLMILINMFLCSLPWQTYRQYLSFSSLMSAKDKDREGVIKLKGEKLKCFINYFKITMEIDYESLSKEIITFQRVTKNCSWEDIISNTSSLSEVKIKQGLIEQEYKNSIMVDFANKNIGGGVLNNGAVQEEILFCVFPELVSIMCLCQQVGDRQALVISGARKINRYSGYSEQFKFEGTCQEWPTQNNHESIIIAIDAIDFSERICKGQSQYTTANIQRQLTKALAGIEGAQLLASSEMPVCTGRWGCGAFRGDPYLKFIIQWLACSIASRKMIYMAQSEQEEIELKVMTKYLKKHDVSELIESITQFNTLLKKNKKTTFLAFLKQFIT